MTSPITLTVSQLNEYIGALIDSSELLYNIYIKGEISNFTNHYKSGHFYFTLKDKTGSLKAVMFRSYALQVPFEPENGMKVTAHGKIAVFERDGIYQLYCDELVPDGVGALYLAYEQLKTKLSEEGLFDESFKKSIPRYPQKIGIITSETGAAIADITNIISRRYPICKTELYPALVQGVGAPLSLINGIRYFDGNVDTIIIGRGGGSIEDLCAFNDENLARVIFSCKTPVISAVGHEIDFTICDFVSDLRAPTPSAAAELAVPDINDLKTVISNYEKLLTNRLCSITANNREKIKAFAENSFFKLPNVYINQKRSELKTCDNQLKAAFEKIINENGGKLSNIEAKLTALNPLAILSRGYGAVLSTDRKIISSVNQAKTGDTIQIRLGDGTIKATVNGISYNNNSEKERN